MFIVLSCISATNDIWLHMYIIPPLRWLEQGFAISRCPALNIQPFREFLWIEPDVWMFLELKFSIKADLTFLHFRWHGVHHKKWVACQGLPFYGWFCASILSLSPFLQVQTYEETLEVLPTQSFASLIKEQTTLTLQMLALRSGVPWRRWCDHCFGRC